MKSPRPNYTFLLRKGGGFIFLKNGQPCSVFEVPQVVINEAVRENEIATKGAIWYKERAPRLLEIRSRY